ncbi:hypothetical protein EST38_g11060 [Candolleomyces aberdarensis]|uniref:Uncharacterized protein n=1 Tax=Candolleomyces aberdarensis TaxID=2316362 RepID=A0A4V1Q2E4_9AGAR|nr:hypothetical protein EST38_g11060 [Candolleomyces aberdarensis]
MNTFYDTDAARGILNAYLAKCYQDGGSTPFLPLLAAEDVEVDRFSNPDCWRLTSTGDGDVEEVQVRIPGILCRSMLPPITRKLSAKDKSTIRSLRQFVKITGLGSHVYGEIQKKMQEIELIFRNALPEHTPKPMVFHEYKGEYAIDVHCRYFTDRRVAPMMKHEGFLNGVDPEHRLEVARGDDSVHGVENVVQYLQVLTDEEGKERYEEVTPSSFKNGDVVEARVAFICYPLYEGGCKIVPTLRSLILLSNQVREVHASIKTFGGLANTGVRAQAAAKRLQEMHQADLSAERGGQRGSGVRRGRCVKTLKRKFIEINYGSSDMKEDMGDM